MRTAPVASITNESSSLHGVFAAPCSEASFQLHQSKWSRFMCMPTLLRRRLSIVAAALANVFAISASDLFAAPQAYFFRGRFDAIDTSALAGDPLGRTKASIWNLAPLASNNAQFLEGIFIYDPEDAVDLMRPDDSNFPTQDVYHFPSPHLLTPALDPMYPTLVKGINGLSYLNSNGKFFRIQLGEQNPSDPANGAGSNEPTKIKVANNVFQPFGPWQFLPGFENASDYVDVITVRSRVNMDPVNGPFVRQFDLNFIDYFSGGSADGSEATLVPRDPGEPIDDPSSPLPSSLPEVLTNEPFIPGLFGGGDGHGVRFQPQNGLVPGQVFRLIAFGDTNGDGVVTAAGFAGDFAALEANYNLPLTPDPNDPTKYLEGYQINGDLDDPFTDPADWIGEAIWTHGDFGREDPNNPGHALPGRDGVVDKFDLAVFNENFVAGNANYDDTVDIFDVAVVSNNWGSSGPRGDVNADGVVDIFDVAVISNHWGQTEASLSAVPEPGSLLLALGMVGGLLPLMRWAVC